MVKTKGKEKKKKLAKKLAQADDDEYEDMDAEDLGATASAASVQQVYLPGDPINEDEELVREESAYEMFHEAQTGKYVCRRAERSIFVSSSAIR